MKHLQGRCITFGDSINTDVIIPGRYLGSIDPKELAEHAFEPLGCEVQEKLKSSEIVVAGKNFGCGSAREQAATCLLGNDIKVVIAKSFARVFFRNAINTGLHVIECPEVVDLINDGDEVEVDFERGEVLLGDKPYYFEPYSSSLQKILDSGGLIPYIQDRVLQHNNR